MWGNIKKKRKCTQGVQKINIYLKTDNWITVSSREAEYLLVKPTTMTWLSHKQRCWVGDVLQAIYTLLLAPVLDHDAVCKPLAAKHFFAPTLSSLLIVTGRTFLIHQRSRNLCLMFLIPCFPDTQGICHAAPSHDLIPIHSHHKNKGTSLFWSCAFC